ncbi:MAG: mechanosensitive ion channel family protein [Microcoleaceae cyanobacterium]
MINTISWVKSILNQLSSLLKPIAILLTLIFSISFTTPVSSQFYLLNYPNPLQLAKPEFKTYQTGDLSHAYITLDGRNLFQIAVENSDSPEQKNDPSLIKRRVQAIEKNLSRIIEIGFSPETLSVSVKDLNNQTVIIAQDNQQLSQQVILTVTQPDAKLAQKLIPDLAEEWTEVIQKKLIQSWKERLSVNRKQNIIRSGKISIGMIALSIIITALQKWLKKHYQDVKKQSKKDSELQGRHLSDQFFSALSIPLSFSKSLKRKLKLERRLDFILLMQRLLQMGQALVWIGSIAWILSLFPETRAQGKWFSSLPLQVIIIWITVTLANQIAHVLINKSIQEWVEQTSAIQIDSQRLFLRAPTISGILKGISNFISVVLAVIWFLAWQQVALGSALAGAGVFGAALSLIFQGLIKDWINGILIIFEDQYSVGDIIELNGTTGFVENMSLRVTQLRSDGGRLSTVPHSQIATVHNLTKDWSRIDFRIEVAYEADVTDAMHVMKDVALAMHQDIQWRDDILEPTVLIGVEKLNHTGSQILMWMKTKRLRQWDVEREYRRRLKQVFDQKGIQIGKPQQLLSLNWQKGNEHTEG